MSEACQRQVLSRGVWEFRRVRGRVDEAEGRVQEVGGAWEGVLRI